MDGIENMEITNSDPANLDNLNQEEIIDLTDSKQSLNKNTNPENLQINENGETADEDNEDLFEGDYEEFQDKSFYADTDYQPNLIENYSSIVSNRRQELYKIIIIRPKKEFEAPSAFNDKGPGEEGNGNNFEFKPIRSNEFPSGDRAILEMGFQTNNESYEKSYQVPRMRMQNALTQVENGLSDIIDIYENRANAYLKDPVKLNNIENFLHKVRSRMEEALQSNETIDIFQNDFDLSRNNQLENASDKKVNETQVEIRSFRDNILAGQKSKKEKSVNYVRIVKNDEVFIAHSLIRNLSFEERARIIGIPYQSQILFWDFVDPEINSQVFSLEIPMEITCFEFCPTNTNLLICGMISGQLIIYEIKDLLGLLKGSNQSENANFMKKGKKFFLLFFIALKKENMYTYYITPIFESHKTHLNSMKWFPKNYSFAKYNLTQNTSGDVSLLATLGEDGLILIWDMKNFDRSVFNDTSNYIKPIMRCEVNKMDCNKKFIFKIFLNFLSKKFLFYKILRK